MSTRPSRASAAGRARTWSAARLGERGGEPDVAQRGALIRGALAGREGRIETQVPVKDGRRLEVEVRYIPVRFGGVDYVLSVARDISRAQCRAGRLARARGAVPGDLRRQRRLAGAVEQRAAKGRHQPRVHAAVRLLARRSHRHVLSGQSRCAGAGRPHRAHPRRARRPGRIAGDLRRAPRRQPLRPRAALPADPLCRRAACAGGGPRHHRTQARRSRRCATARPSTARSSTPRPMRWCCAMPISASSTSTPPTST